MDKAWKTPPTAVPLTHQGVSFHVAGGSVFVSPRGQFLMSLDTVRQDLPSRVVGQRVLAGQGASRPHDCRWPLSLRDFRGAG